MKTIGFYLDCAKEKTGLSTDLALNFALGYKGLSVSDIRNGRKFPSDHVMLKLADMAGVPPEEALLDLNSWRTKGTSAAPIYERMARALHGIVLCFMLTLPALINPTPANASIYHSLPEKGVSFPYSQVIHYHILSCWVQAPPKDSNAHRKHKYRHQKENKIKI